MSQGRAHEANSVCGPTPIITLKNSLVTSLMLWPHWNIATYCDSNHLLTPRNGRRKFRNPVQVPCPRALGTRVIHRRVYPVVPPTDPAVPAPLVGVDRRPRQARPVHEL